VWYLDANLRLALLHALCAVTSIAKPGESTK